MSSSAATVVGSGPCLRCVTAAWPCWALPAEDKTLRGGGVEAATPIGESTEDEAVTDDSAAASDDAAEGSDGSGGAAVPDDADALAVFDIDRIGSYEIALTIPSGVSFISEEALTISGEGPGGESASVDVTASLDATSVYLDVPDDGVQVGAGDAAVSGGDPVQIEVSGDRVSGSAVFVCAP
jgi:hypothetical protein